MVVAFGCADVIPGHEADRLTRTGHRRSGNDRKAGRHRFKLVRIERLSNPVVGDRGVEGCDIFTVRLIDHAGDPVDRLIVGWLRA